MKGVIVGTVETRATVTATTKGLSVTGMMAMKGTFFLPILFVLPLVVIKNKTVMTLTAIQKHALIIVVSTRI